MRSSTKALLALILGYLLAMSSTASAALNLVGGPSFQYATVYTDLAYTIGVDDSVVGDPAGISSQNLSANYAPGAGLQAGSASTTTNFGIGNTVVTGSGSVSAGSGENAGPNLTLSDSLVLLYFDVTDTPIGVFLSAAGTVSNNESATPPAYFYIADASNYLTPLYDFAGLPAQNGAFSVGGVFTLPVGNYVFASEMIVEASGNNVATGEISYSFGVVPEPGSMVAWSVFASIGLALGRRRLRRVPAASAAY